MLDIYDVKPISEIEPLPGLFQPVRPLREVNTIAFDIETAGLSPETARIYMIGLLTSNGTVRILQNDDEKTTLTQFSSLLEKIGSCVLYGHNIFTFDIPFIIRRCEILGVPTTLKFRKLRDHSIMQRAFKVGGTYPLIYNDVRCPGIDFVDTLMLVRLFDSKYLFSDQTLKTTAIEIGSRKDRRLELGHEEIDSRWHEGCGGRAVLEKYLRYDLEDTHALFYKLYPAYYSMSSFLQMPLQEIVLASSAKKVESLLMGYYRQKDDWVEPEALPKIEYAGALTMARPGLYTNVTKIDVASQYPFIMLAYRVGTSKDPDGMFWRILKELRDLRLVYKKKKDEDSEAVSDAMKIIINSAYGMLGSERPFNDPPSAQRVCEYGRAIVTKMMECIQEAGGKVLEVDTDGVVFVGDKEAVVAHVRSKMPAGLELDIEYTAAWMFIGAAKNYMYQITDRVIRKGIYKKRNQIPLMVEYTETYCKRWLENPAAAAEYHRSVQEALIVGIDIKKIAVRRTISKSEKTCLKYGKAGDKITVYRGVDERGKPTPVISGQYHLDFYQKLLEKWKAGIDEYLQHPQELSGKSVVDTTTADTAVSVL